MARVAVVTGASKGIGGVTATLFGKSGYDVVINYRNDDAAAQQIVEHIKAAGNKAVMVKADIFTEQGIAELFDVARKEFDTVDVLINNAGDPNEKSLGEYTQTNVTESLNQNFISAVLCTQAAVPLLNPGGSILFTSSIYGLPFGGNPNLPLYSAGKAALINFTQTMAEKLAAQQIRCNVVAPGTTRTPNWDGVSEEYVQKSLDMTLLKEWVAAEEIAEAFLFLAKTPHITGQTITIDAGWQKKIRENSPPRH